MRPENLLNHYRRSDDSAVPVPDQNFQDGFLPQHYKGPLGRNENFISKFIE
jgi:hypothetical protein